jgi:hypothetical protein
MSERAPARTRSKKTAATASIHFRMPPGLRSRLRRFAEDRNLGESEAMRLALSERLDLVDDERELAAAERWQFEQAYKTWKEDERTGGKDRVPWSRIERRFTDALSEIERRRKARK